jgi:hypothetical protein
MPEKVMGALNGDPLNVREGGHQDLHASSRPATSGGNDAPVEYAIGGYRIDLVISTRKFRINPARIITRPRVKMTTLTKA